MKTRLLAALSLALFTLPASAGDQYDRTLEEAAIRIVAAKIGDIRGGFAIDQQPVFVQPIEKAFVSSAMPGEWRDGIALAAGGRAIRVSSF